MASVPSASARAAVTRCPRRVLQTTGARASGGRVALEKGPAWHDLKQSVPSVRSHWAPEGQAQGARHREAGRLWLGTSGGRWGQAVQKWAVHPESRCGSHQLRSAKLVAPGTAQLGNLCLLFHWSTLTKDGRETRDNPSRLPPVNVPNPPGAFQVGTCLHVTLGLGAPNIWKWHLVWKKRGPTATALLHSTPSVAKQECAVHQSRKNRGLTKEAAETHQSSDIPLTGSGGTNHQGLEFKEALLKGQEGTCKEVPEVFMLEHFLLKEALQMGQKIITTKLESTLTTEDLLVGQAHASQEFPSTTQILAICGTAPESTMLNNSLKLRYEGTWQKEPTCTTLAELLLENKYLTWKTYPDKESLSTCQKVATLVKHAIQRQEDMSQEVADAPHVKEIELPEQVDDLEIQKLRQLQQRRLKQWPWGS